jgi:hypothetical protein
MEPSLADPAPASSCVSDEDASQGLDPLHVPPTDHGPATLWALRSDVPISTMSERWTPPGIQWQPRSEEEGAAAALTSREATGVKEPGSGGGTARQSCGLTRPGSRRSPRHCATSATRFPCLRSPGLPACSPLVWAVSLWTWTSSSRRASRMLTGTASAWAAASDSFVLQRFSRVERVTRIELALSAWESYTDPPSTLRGPDLTWS